MHILAVEPVFAQGKAYAGRMAVSAQVAPSVDLVFDGKCGLCTRIALWLQRVDRRGRVEIHPLQRPGVLGRFGLTEQEALGAAWAFRRPVVTGAPVRSTAPHRGAAAVNLTLDAVFGTCLFSTIYRLPGIWWLQDRGYQWIADHRYMLKGVTPWCAQHPEDCPGADGPMSCTIAQ